MADITENTQNPVWSNGIYQIETSDPVLGGVNGIANRQAKELAERTQWLKTELAKAVQSIGTNQTATNNGLATKADKTRQISVGAGLTGGGDLTANRIIGLATPSTLSGSTTNWVGNGATGHTHQLAAATATVAGVAKLIDGLNSDDGAAALSARQGKALAEQIAAKTWESLGSRPFDVKVVERTIDANDLKKDGIYAFNSGGINLPDGNPYHVCVIAGTSGAWARQIAYRAYKNERYVRTLLTANGAWGGWERDDGADWSSIRGKPTNFTGYGILGNQVLNGSPTLTSHYPAVVLQSTATGASKKWLLEANGNDAYFVQRDNTANNGGTLLHLPTRAGTLALDGEVVKLTDDQTIAGTKTFSGSLKITGANILPFANWREMIALTGDHAAITINNRYAFALHHLLGKAYFFDVNSRSYAIEIKYATKTLIAHGDVVSGSHRLTTKANANEVVKLTGDQTIAGTKTFSGSLKTTDTITSGGNVIASGDTKTAHLGVSATDVFVSNSKSDKYLQLKDNGELAYSDDKVLLSSDFSHSHAAVGYQKLANGLIFQWGNTVVHGDAYVGTHFPISFPNSCINVQTTIDIAHAVAGATVISTHVGNLSRTGFSIGVSENGISGGHIVHWLAIGF